MRPGWSALFLIALSLAVTLLAPLMLEFQPRLEVALVWCGAGALLLALGLWLRRISLQALGSVALWVEMAASLSTQTVPFGTPVGSVWAPRIVCLTLALVIWVFLMRPARWLQRALVALALSTASVGAVFWLNVPRVAISASLTWLVVDSHGALYATEIDNGALWRFERDGSRSLLFPARAVAGEPGTGWQPASVGIELPPVTNTQIVNLTAFRQPLLFCGLSVDPDDRLYIVDPNRHEVRQFTPDGQMRRAWALPANYSLTQGCIAATRDRVYVADATGYIHVYDHDGRRLGQWQQAPATHGLTRDAYDQVFVLRERSIVMLDGNGGDDREWELPAPTEGLSAPYQSLLVLRSGEFLVTDVNRGQVRRFDALGRESPALGLRATWPGQFAGPGGLPGEIVEPLGLAEDDANNLYVSDTGFRIVQRFRPDGRVDLVVAAPEDESNERSSEPCVSGTC